MIKMEHDGPAVRVDLMRRRRNSRSKDGETFTVLLQNMVYGALKRVDSVGMIKTDQRGRHNTKCNRISLNAQDFIEEHIKSFPAVPSHYCRKTSSKQYLSNELNISNMYRLYKEKCQQSFPEVIPESKEAYSNVFHTKKLAFLMPKKDRCDFCVGYENKREHTQEEIMEYNIHIERKNTAQKDWKDVTKKNGKG